MPETIYIDGDEVRFGGGKFDTDNKYIRTAKANKLFSMVKGVSFQIQYGNQNFMSFKFDGDTHTVSNNLGGTVTFDADYQDVKLEDST